MTPETARAGQDERSVTSTPSASAGACVVCGGPLASRARSGCCSPKCRAAKSRLAAEQRRREELNEIIRRLDGLRAVVVRMREA